MTTRTMRMALTVALGALAVTGCNFDIGNPNSPDPIGNNPSRARVAASATGLLAGLRGYYPQYILLTSIIGRDGYRFDGSDPRFTSEALTGQLDAGGFIGVQQWPAPYRNIRTANELLKYVGTATTLSAEEISATQGYTHTMMALDFLNILVGHTQDSIPIDVGVDVSAPPAPFVTQAVAYTHVENLLDSAVTELQNGGTAFPFELSSGFTGFDTPTNFIKFNRALRARVDVYRQNWGQALTDLTASFVDTLASLDVGVYNIYSTGSGEVNNTLNQATAENFARPELRDSAQLQTGGVLLDRRFLTKTFSRTSQTTSGLTSDLGWARYPTPSSPIPIIRNEELILIRAEANIQLGNLGPALDDINFIRVNSGGLPPLAAFADQATAINAMLVERRYSLVFEWGHRWIDMRRYGRLTPAPANWIDRPGDLVYTTFPVPTDEVLARQ
jgi:hypothetical protein